MSSFNDDDGFGDFVEPEYSQDVLASATADVLVVNSHDVTNTTCTSKTLAAHSRGSCGLGVSPFVQLMEGSVEQIGPALNTKHSASQSGALEEGLQQQTFVNHDLIVAACEETSSVPAVVEPPLSDTIPAVAPIVLTVAVTPDDNPVCVTISPSKRVFASSFGATRDSTTSEAMTVPCSNTTAVSGSTCAHPVAGAGTLGNVNGTTSVSQDNSDTETEQHLVNASGIVGIIPPGVQQQATTSSFASSPTKEQKADAVEEFGGFTDAAVPQSADVAAVHEQPIDVPSIPLESYDQLNGFTRAANTSADLQPPAMTFITEQHTPFQNTSAAIVSDEDSDCFGDTSTAVVPDVTVGQMGQTSFKWSSPHTSHDADEDDFGDFEDALTRVKPLQPVAGVTASQVSHITSSDFEDAPTAVQPSQIAVDVTSCQSDETAAQWQPTQTKDEADSFGDFGDASTVAAVQPAVTATISQPTEEAAHRQPLQSIGEADYFSEFEDAPAVQPVHHVVTATTSQSTAAAAQTQPMPSTKNEIDDDFGDFEDAPIVVRLAQAAVDTTASQADEAPAQWQLTHSSKDNDDFGDFEDAPSALHPAQAAVKTTTSQADGAATHWQSTESTNNEDDDDFGEFEDAPTAECAMPTSAPATAPMASATSKSVAPGAVDTTDLLILRDQQFTWGCRQILETLFGKCVVQGIGDGLPSLSSFVKEATAAGDASFSLLCFFGLPANWDALPFKALEWKGTVLEETFLDRLGLLETAAEVTEQLQLEEEERKRKEEDEKKKAAEAAVAAAAAKSAGDSATISGSSVPHTSSFSSLASDSAEGKLAAAFSPSDSKLNLNFMGRPDTPAETVAKDSQPPLSSAAIQPPMPKSLRLSSGSRPGSAGPRGPPSRPGSSNQLPLPTAEQYAGLAAKSAVTKPSGSAPNSTAVVSAAGVPHVQSTEGPAHALPPLSGTAAPEKWDPFAGRGAAAAVKAPLGPSGADTLPNADEKLVQDMVSNMHDMTYLFADELIYPKM